MNRNYSPIRHSQGTYVKITFIFLGYFIPTVILCSTLSHFVYAQPLHPAIELDRPSPFSSSLLQQLRSEGTPRVGVYHSRNSEHIGLPEQTAVRESITSWEYLLLGLEIPYIIVEDSILVQTELDQLELLIVPHAVSMSDQQVEAILEFIKNGGGMMASGGIARFDEHGNERDEVFFEEFIGLSPLVEFSGSTSGLFQKVYGDHPVVRGLPLGYNLSVSCSSVCTVVNQDTEHSIGEVLYYGDVWPSIDWNSSGSLISTNSYGNGRVVWFGFSPIDMASDLAEQKIYQTLVLNAMSYLLDVAAVSVKAWPNGYQSASALVQLPPYIYSPFSYRESTILLLQALEESQSNTTFFLVSQHAKEHPDILSRMHSIGEIGLVADTERPLEGQPLELQSNRLSMAKAYLEERGSQMIKGVYPPELLYDANTLRALIDLDMNYVVSGVQGFWEPEFVQWETELDYRDSLVTAKRYVNRDSLTYKEKQISRKQLLQFYPSLYSYELNELLISDPVRSNDSTLKKRWLSELKRAFGQMHEAGGLFLFTFAPEIMGLSLQRASVLEEFSLYLNTQASWRATLSEIATWWMQREAVSVELERIPDNQLEITLENSSTQIINGISLDVYIPSLNPDTYELEAETVETNWELHDGRITVVADSVLPGKHTLRWLPVQSMNVEQMFD